MIIKEELVRRLLRTVDVGLTAGIGKPIPGQMCVEAAISYALGEPHSDGPSCVDAAVRAGKICLNDCSWSSNMARAKGMRRVAIAQLGSKDTIDSVKYVTLLAQYTINEIVPLAAKSAAVKPAARYAAESAAELAAKSARYAESAARYADSAAISAKSAAMSARYAESDARYAAGTAARYAAESARYAESAARYAEYAEYDEIFRISAELMVRALKECGSPGCDWLWLCDEVTS